MYCIQNLTNRKIIFQGIEIRPHGSINVNSVSDFVCLSKFINAGKLSYTIIKGVPTVEEPKKVIVQLEEKTPEVVCDLEKTKENVVKEPVTEVVGENTLASKPEDASVEEDKPTSKKGRKKRFDKLD